CGVRSLVRRPQPRSQPDEVLRELNRGVILTFEMILSRRVTAGVGAAAREVALHHDRWRRIQSSLTGRLPLILKSRLVDNPRAQDLRIGELQRRLRSARIVAGVRKNKTSNTNVVLVVLLVLEPRDQRVPLAKRKIDSRINLSPRLRQRIRDRIVAGD